MFPLSLEFHNKIQELIQTLNLFLVAVSHTDDQLDMSALMSSVNPAFEYFYFHANAREHFDEQKSDQHSPISDSPFPLWQLPWSWWL